MPAQETAIGILSQAIVSLESQPMPAHLEVVEFLMSYVGSAAAIFPALFVRQHLVVYWSSEKKLAKSRC